jgi:hypothetical protein
VAGPAITQWPSVDGTIVSAEIKPGSGRGLRPEVTYRFTVSGQEHAGNIIQFGLRQVPGGECRAYPRAIHNRFAGVGLLLTGQPSRFRPSTWSELDGLDRHFRRLRDLLRSRTIADPDNPEVIHDVDRVVRHRVGSSACVLNTRRASQVYRVDQ